jgi:murein DD-endopeptidase MepM/ murein hydrolase activator NlpD
MKGLKNMSIWPIEENRKSDLPNRNTSGSFWARIGNFYNCGIDLYSDENKLVKSMFSGTVIHKGKFTSKDDKSYLNDSDYVVIKTDKNLHIKYAGIKASELNYGQRIEAGQIIGKILSILDNSKKNIPTTMIDVNLISYFENPRLHLEVYKPPFVEIKPYSFGLFKAQYQPEAIIDPTLLLENTEHLKIVAI